MFHICGNTSAVVADRRGTGNAREREPHGSRRNTNQNLDCNIAHERSPMRAPVVTGSRLAPVIGARVLRTCWLVELIALIPVRFRRLAQFQRAISVTGGGEVFTAVQ